MTADEQQLLTAAVTQEWRRDEAVAVMLAAKLVTPAYAAWYAAQTPLRRSAEWAPGGFLLLQVRKFGALTGIAGLLMGAAQQKLEAAGDAASKLAQPFVTFWSWVRAVVIGVVALVVLLVLAVAFRK